MVSTLDSESSDPSSNLGGTSSSFIPSFVSILFDLQGNNLSTPITAVIAQLGER